jgi:hypothetical protein
MSTPSRKKSTRETVSDPTMVTLAFTGIVSLTVEPAVGDVMLTVRLPSCAVAGWDDIEAQPSNATTTPARARLARTAGIMTCLSRLANR